MRRRLPRDLSLYNFCFISIRPGLPSSLYYSKISLLESSARLGRAMLHILLSYTVYWLRSIVYQQCVSKHTVGNIKTVIHEKAVSNFI